MCFHSAGGHCSPPIPPSTPISERNDDHLDWDHQGDQDDDKEQILGTKFKLGEGKTGHSADQQPDCNRADRKRQGVGNGAPEVAQLKEIES
jgi:hypothetical protein